MIRNVNVLMVSKLLMENAFRSLFRIASSTKKIQQNVVSVCMEQAYLVISNHAFLVRLHCMIQDA